jgi:hypothetical protein
MKPARETQEQKEWRAVAERQRRRSAAIAQARARLDKLLYRKAK